MSDSLAVVERAEPPARSRTLVVPDLGAGALAILARLEEILSTLAAWEEAEDCDLVLPVPLAGGRALAAVRRLWDALVPTQAVDEGGHLDTGEPVYFVDVEQADLDALAAISVRFCQATSAAEAPESKAIADAFELHLRGGGTTAGQLIADAVRLHSVLDLACTIDAAPLRATLDSGSGRLALFRRDLTAAQGELISRLTRVWSYAAV